MFREEMEFDHRGQLINDLRKGMTRDEINHLIRNIYLAIEAELRDSAYYRSLADVANERFATEIFSEFSRDEREHAYELQQVYEELSGKEFILDEEEKDIEITDYIKAVEKRVVDESADYKKYKDYYLMVESQYLRDIFFNLMHAEAYHAIRELYILYTHMRGIMMDMMYINN